MLTSTAYSPLSPMWHGALALHCQAAVAEGITSLATVHDNFGCLPSRAERFRRIIRGQFVDYAPSAPV